MLISASILLTSSPRTVWGIVHQRAVCQNRRVPRKTQWPSGVTKTSGERLASSGQTPVTPDNMHNRRVYPAEGTILSLSIARRSNDQRRINKKNTGQVLGQKSPASLSTGDQRWAIKNADTTKESQKRRPTPQTHPEARPSRTPGGRGTKVTPVNGHSFG